MRTVDAQPEPVAYAEWRAASQADINYGYDLIPGELRGQLKADRRNLQSRAAVERLGAMREESFATPAGSRWFIRDSVMYSVIDSGGPR